MRSKGISLNMLIVVIVIIILLVSVVVISTKQTIDNSILSSFSKDLSIIEDSTVTYYLNNNEFPTDKNKLNKSDILALIDSKIVDKWNEELKLNSDELVSEFYQISLNKINVTKSNKGDLKNGHNDMYVIAYPSLNVYYLKGLKVDNDIYFSLTSKLIKISKTNFKNEDDNSLTSVSKTGGIIVTKKSGFTNKMRANIKTNISSNESLKIKVGNSSEKIVNTNTGLNNIPFDNVSELIPKTSGLTENDSKEFDKLPQKDKKIEVSKYKENKEIGSVKVDFSNYEVDLPKITKATINSYDKINTVALTLNDSVSNIKEVRYEFLKKYEDSGVVSSYYSNREDFDSEYMLSNAKVVEIKNNIATISAPKNVKTLKIAVIDNAGNVSLYNQEISSRLFIGYEALSTTDEIKFKAKINSTTGVKSIVMSCSTNGIDFNNEETFNINTNYNGITEAIKTFTKDNNLKLYVKIIATNYDNTITENRIVDLDLNNIILESSNGYYDINKNVNKPILLKGLTPIKFNSDIQVTNETDISWYDYVDQGTYLNDGKTSRWANAISKDNSQWVWIPRYAYKIDICNTSTPSKIDILFLKDTTNKYKNDSGEFVDIPNGYIVHPAFSSNVNLGGWNKELPGLWVSKYEAGYSNTAKESIVKYTGVYKNVNNIYGKITPNYTKIKYPAFINNLYSYNYINIGDSYSICKDLSSISNPYGFDKKSNPHLMKNTEWGAVAYLAHSKYGRNGVEITINNTNKNSNNVNAVTAGGNYKLNTLQSTTGNVYGIYDMVGGNSEITSGYILNNAGNNSRKNYGGLLITDNNLKYKTVYETHTTDRTENNFLINNHRKGEAIFETSRDSDMPYSNSWFNDYSFFVENAFIFFMRGGNYNDSKYAGLFSYFNTDGRAYNYDGFRAVLVYE